MVKLSKQSVFKFYRTPDTVLLSNIQANKKGVRYKFIAFVLP
jgi:hypothetical protein